ncbi:hypothetical protein LTR09_009191 [Extremus antarcticus]|uniref:Uncharacterized protein n=1 Tax=Extremus antarcticus TaxID=702011 RepID=A0AAJ0D9J1_9PEZI|nr:hypothetical protein LTR09_009191 [Extremus antarcticus]
MSVDRLPAHHLEEWDEYCDAMVQDAMCLFPEDENVATRGDQIVQHGGEHKTGWMNLPRELRDAIYEYAVVSDSVRVIHHTRTKAITADRSSMRIWERRPRLCKAIPLFHEEILEAYYRLNAFKMGCKLVHKHLFLLKWAKQAGKPFTEHLGHLQLGLGRIANLQYSHPWPPANLKVDAFLVGRSLKVKLTSGSNRAYCSCDVLGQSEKRLLEDDICNDPDWQQRLQDTASSEICAQSPRDRKTGTRERTAAQALRETATPVKETDALYRLRRVGVAVVEIIVSLQEPRAILV